MKLSYALVSKVIPAMRHKPPWRLEKGDRTTRHRKSIPPKDPFAPGLEFCRYLSTGNGLCPDTPKREQIVYGTPRTSPPDLGSVYNTHSVTFRDLQDGLTLCHLLRCC